MKGVLNILLLFINGILQKLKRLDVAFNLRLGVIDILVIDLLGLFFGLETTDKRLSISGQLLVIQLLVGRQDIIAKVLRPAFGLGHPHTLGQRLVLNIRSLLLLF